jgi:predicted amidophosphoribosyltransferase
MNTTTCNGLERVWYMCYYFKWGTSDWLSRQMMDFKRGDAPQIEAFSNLASEEMKKLGKSFDIVMRVLGSKELTATKASKLAVISRKIRDELGNEYNPNIVKKNRVTKELKSLGKEARKKELEGVYELYKDEDLNNKRILIVDDIFTFGTSFEAIAEVIKRKYPNSKLYGFVLAHNWIKGDNGVVINEADFIERYTKELSKVKAKKK